MVLSIKKAELGQTYRVVAVQGVPESTQRIRELGLVVGAFCRVVRKSPFGGPMEVALDRRHLGLRLSGIEVLVEPFERSVAA
jgi:Fe2+ transport system protein FeoA